MYTGRFVALWGVIFRPTTFDPARKYPVIENIYAGPQGSFVPKSFAAFNAMQATAELGFIVVQIDGMGTSNRSKAFHDVAWKNLGDAGFPDRILWHKAVAAKYPFYDITRVGLYGTSAGGQSSLGGLLFHPEFYDVAVSSAFRAAPPRRGPAGLESPRTPREDDADVHVRFEIIATHSADQRCDASDSARSVKGIRRNSRLTCSHPFRARWIQSISAAGNEQGAGSEEGCEAVVAPCRTPSTNTTPRTRPQTFTFFMRGYPCRQLRARRT
jgi:hypothetical protein